VTHTTAAQRPGTLPIFLFITRRSCVPPRLGPSRPPMLGFLHGPRPHSGPTPTAPGPVARATVTPSYSGSRPHGHVMSCARPRPGHSPSGPFDHLVTSPQVQAGPLGARHDSDGPGHVPIARTGPAPPARLGRTRAGPEEPALRSLYGPALTGGEHYGMVDCARIGRRVGTVI
jgi:hypothetical protein